MKRIIISGKIVCDEVFDGSVVVEDGIITDVVHGEIKNLSAEKGEIFKFDSFILPSFVELHAHGGNGYDFSDSTAEAYDEIFNAHLSHGVTYMCPTLTSCPFDKLVNALEFAKRYKQHEMFAGLHLEGPFLSPVMCGAQNKDCIYTPDADKLVILSSYSDIIARISAAPEVTGVIEFAEKMISLGVKMSIGHSNANAAEFAHAKEVGFDSVTHLYSSTSSRHKEGSYVRAGIIEAALADSDIYIELIGDGHHVSRENIILTNKCAPQRVCLVSDAMRAAGLKGAVYESYLGEIIPENRVILEDGVAKLPDRSSFAGSLAIGDTMLKAMCADYGIPITKVSEMMSETPSKALGINCRGRLARGYVGDITAVNKSYETEAVFVRGIRRI